MHLNWMKRGTGTPLLLLHEFTGIGQDWRAIFGVVEVDFRHLMPGQGHCPVIGKMAAPSKSNAVEFLRCE